MRTGLAALAAAIAITAWSYHHYRFRPLLLEPPPPPLPTVSWSATQTLLRPRGLNLVADARTFDDELLAYLMYGSLRRIAERDGHRAWLTYERNRNAISYVIRLELQPDLLTAIPYLYHLQEESAVEGVNFRWVVPRIADAWRSQSEIFDRVYNLPATRKLEHLPRSELVAYMRRYIRYKSATDPRIRGRIEPVPKPPSKDDAHRLAEDIVTVADFYLLPLDFFLGIGAMENNYMHVQGDLDHAVWKKRRDKGDVVLKRGRRGYLVLNQSSGIWQITRETLRYAHRRFLEDTRDYAILPEHLRPVPELDIDDVPPALLTTYAGLLFRDLLDKFEGDVTKAVGAYNGGPGNPNLKYEGGVRTVANHARRILEHAASLRGESAAGMSFLASLP